MKPIGDEIVDQLAHFALAFLFCEMGTWYLAAIFVLERERIQHGWMFWHWGWGARRDVIFAALGVAFSLAF